MNYACQNQDNYNRDRYIYISLGISDRKEASRGVDVQHGLY